MVTVALLKLALGYENDQRFDVAGRFWYGTKPAGGQAMPFGVAGRDVVGPNTNSEFAGRGGTTPPAMSPVAIAARGGNSIQRRCPAAALPAPGSDMYRSMARGPLAPRAMFEFDAPAAPSAL